jgi:dipeptidyl aminopeptidase/acylaminoacyl peptidase
MGPEATAEAYAEASPQHHVSPSFPPTMLLHSNLDDLVPPEQSLDMFTRLREAGVPCELHMFDGQPHAFDGEPSLGRLSATLVDLFLRRFLTAPDPLSKEQP